MLLFKKEGKNYYPRRLVSLSKIVINIWIVLVLFTIISVIAGQSSKMPGSLMEFIANFFLVSNSYNGAWWYALTYVLIVIMSPVILRLLHKNNTVIVLLIGFVIYCVSYYVRFRVDASNWPIKQLYLLGMTSFEYLIGSAFCKENVFTKISTFWNKMFLSRRTLAGYIILFGIFIAMLAGHTLIIRSTFIAPFTGAVLLIEFQLWRKPEWTCKFFDFIGKHSTNLWLTHMFFYLVLFTNLVFIAKYPLFIYLFMLALTLAVSWCIQVVHRPTLKVIDKLAGRLLKERASRELT